LPRLTNIFPPGFTQGKAYALTDARGHQQVVDLYVKAAHGKAVRDWPFITCSDRPFTEAEWNRYKQVCLSEGLPVPSKPDLVDKIADINALIHRQWTDQEVSEKLRRQNALLAKYTQRETVAKQLELARQRGDEEQAAKLQEKLDSLDVPRLAFRTQLKLGPSATSTTSPKKPSAGAASSGGAGGGGGGGSGSTLSQQEKLALLNLENRRKNAETVRKAHLMERARAREQARAAAAAAAAANGNKNGSQNGSRSGTPAAAEKGEGEAALLPHIAKLQELQRSKEEKKGLPVIHKPLMDDEVIGALDLEIDVEIE
jgi:RNA polymerase-associated protein RTF1